MSVDKNGKGKVVYVPDDLKDLDSRELGNPGEFPYTRGIHPEMYTKGNLPTVRKYWGFGTGAELNQYLKDFQKELNGIQSIKDMMATRKTTGIKIAGMVTKVQKIVTKTGKPMMFSWIEDMTGKIEVVVFPTVLSQHPEVFQENAIITVSGKLNDRDGVPKLLCDDVKSIAILA